MPMYVEHSDCFLQDAFRGREIGVTIQKTFWKLFVINAAEIIDVEEPCNEAARGSLASL